MNGAVTANRGPPTWFRRNFGSICARQNSLDSARKYTISWAQHRSKAAGLARCSCYPGQELWEAVLSPGRNAGASLGGSGCRWNCIASAFVEQSGAVCFARRRLPSDCEAAVPPSMLSRAFRQSALLCAAAAEARCRASVQSLKTAYFLTMKFSAAATFREEGPGRPDGGAHPLARGVGALLRLLYAVPVRLVRLVMRRMVLALRHSGWWLLRLGRAEPTSDVCRPSQRRVLSAPCRAFQRVLCCS